MNFHLGPGRNVEGAGRGIAEGAWIAGKSLACAFPRSGAERLVLDAPAALQSHFAAWAAQGAEILLAPTLEAHPQALKSIGLGPRLWEINRNALELVRDVARGFRHAPKVAVQLGPVALPAGEHGPVPFDRLYVQYHEQVKALVLAGVDFDLALLRGFRDPRSVRAALAALRELWPGPVVAILESDALWEPSAEAPGAGAGAARLLRALRGLDLAGVGFRAAPTGLSEEGVLRLSGHCAGWPLRALEVAAAAGEPRPPAGAVEGALARAFRADIDLVVAALDAADAELARREQALTRAERAPEPIRLDAGRARAARSGDAAPKTPDLLVVHSDPIDVEAWKRRLEALPAKLRDAGVAIPAIALPLAAACAPAEAERGVVEAERRLGELGAPAIGVLGSELRALEAAAKAASAAAVLVIERLKPDEVEGALYLAKRYGARIVLPLHASPGGAEDLVRRLQELFGESLERGRMPAGAFGARVLVDVAAGAQGTSAPPSVAQLAPLLRELQALSGVGWAVSVARDAAASACEWLSSGAVELVILCP
jgi:hypothetical protein